MLYSNCLPFVANPFSSRSRTCQHTPPAPQKTPTTQENIRAISNAFVNKHKDTVKMFIATKRYRSEIRHEATSLFIQATLYNDLSAFQFLDSFPTKLHDESALLKPVRELRATNLINADTYAHFSHTPHLSIRDLRLRIHSFMYKHISKKTLDDYESRLRLSLHDPHLTLGSLGDQNVAYTKRQVLTYLPQFKQEFDQLKDVIDTLINDKEFSLFHTVDLQRNIAHVDQAALNTYDMNRSNKEKPKLDTRLYDDILSGGLMLSYKELTKRGINMKKGATNPGEDGIPGDEVVDDFVFFTLSLGDAPTPNQSTIRLNYPLEKLPDDIVILSIDQLEPGYEKGIIQKQHLKEFLISSFTTWLCTKLEYDYLLDTFKQSTPREDDFPYHPERTELINFLPGGRKGRHLSGWLDDFQKGTITSNHLSDYSRLDWTYTTFPVRKPLHFYEQARPALETHFSEALSHVIENETVFKDYFEQYLVRFQVLFPNRVALGVTTT